MKTREEYIQLLRANSETLMNNYGIKSLKLFGSMARGEQHEDSDVDVLVDTATPSPFLLMDAKTFLEELTGRSVDVIRNHRNMNPRLRKRIEHDGVIVF